MGINVGYGYIYEIIEILQFKGVACKAICGPRMVANSTIGHTYIEIHESGLYWRYARKTSNEDNVEFFDECNIDMQKKFIKRQAFSEWYMIHKQLPLLTC